MNDNIFYRVSYQTNHNSSSKDFHSYDEALVFFKSFPKGGAIMYKMERVM